MNRVTPNLVHYVYFRHQSHSLCFKARSHGPYHESNIALPFLSASNWIMLVKNWWLELTSSFSEIDTSRDVSIQ